MSVWLETACFDGTLYGTEFDMLKFLSKTYCRISCSSTVCLFITNIFAVSYDTTRLFVISACFRLLIAECMHDSFVLNVIVCDLHKHSLVLRCLSIFSALLLCSYARH